ncbi:hypothetical protein ECZC20_35160 [Escherichia coli]|nr:hypothetical protein ECZC08_35180 [Escherichia coli]GJI44491.1 hypothetical protein ECZC20_35160 [Escherichia coli]
MRENAARAYWQRRLNYQNCVIWYFAPLVISAGAAGASCSGWRAYCKPECQEKTKPAEAGMLKQTESNMPDL